MILIGLKNNLRRLAVSMNTTRIPFDNIVKFGQSTMLENNLFNVSWILSRFCNYNCSYCWPYAHSKKVDHRPLEVYKKTMDEIKTQARANGFNSFHFSFSGGEPTAYKRFLPLIGHYAKDEKARYQSIHMTTNCSPGKKWWSTWIQATETLKRRSITASFHHEFADEDAFGDKLLMLQDAGVYVTINQVMVPHLFEELYDRCSRFHQRGINVTLKPQSNESASEIVSGYTDDQIEMMKTGFPLTIENGELVQQLNLIDHKNNMYNLDQAERFNAFGFNKFKGWTCNAGYQSCIVREPGGEIKRAYSCHDEPLGTIDEGFKLFRTPNRCITATCVSSADSKIPKHRELDKLEAIEREEIIMEISRKQSKAFKKERTNV